MDENDKEDVQWRKQLSMGMAPSNQWEVEVQLVLYVDGIWGIIWMIAVVI